MRWISGDKRPAHLGTFPLERLRRTAAPQAAPRRRALKTAPPPASDDPAEAAFFYRGLYAPLRDGALAQRDEAVALEPEALARELKGLGYFLDAACMGVAAGDDSLWTAPAPHAAQAFVSIMVEHKNGASPEAAETRAAQISVIVAGFLRCLGVGARAHSPGESELDLEQTTVHAGLALWRGDRVRSPFLGEAFALAAVSVETALAHDQPLASDARADLGWLIGQGGTQSALDRWLKRLRPAHLGPHPMEKIKRVDKPTTLIFEDEIPQVSGRAQGYLRAAHGDMGEKVQAEVGRFVLKTPAAYAMRFVMNAQAPHQTGPVASVQQAGDPNANARAVKALAHGLGADIVSVCETPRYAWYSHKNDGTPIVTHPRYAITLLIDQGYETMEGSSGDDWMSGAQSTRAYMRGAEIAGQIARHIRARGYPARAETNLDSEVLHPPLLLLSGAGELSRIGEIILNPFIGPRFKSAVVTTDLPLACDRPIDFGLQDMCRKCFKCARECPCNAISWSEPVIFNGYEMWKPDVERCTRYRLVNVKGSSCGRCVKVCPYNHEGLLQHSVFLWLAIKVPRLRKWIVDLDDKFGRGEINPIKRWWRELELIGPLHGRDPKKQDMTKLVAREPTVEPNRRTLNLKRKSNQQPIAYVHADMMPPPDAQGPVNWDRRAAVKAGEKIETPAQALARRAAGGAKPAHYQPTPPRGESLSEAAAPEIKEADRKETAP